MDTYTMNKLKSLLRVLPGKAVVRAVLALLFVAASLPLFAQTAEVRYAGVFYADSQTDIKGVYCDYTDPSGAKPYIFTPSKDAVGNRSFYVDTVQPSNNGNKNDPWASSALIEYDQPYPSPTAVNNYPNHCLALCMNVVCTNRPMSQSTYSISFPLQQIKFDVVKYYNNKNIANPEESPAVRTIDLYPDTESSSAKCGSYHCIGSGSGNPCSGAMYECSEGSVCTAKKDDDASCKLDSDDKTYKGMSSKKCWKVGDTNKTSLGAPSTTLCGEYGEHCMVFDQNGTESGVNIPFCAAWDGSYEIAGEFGKSNGQFGFRASVATDFPGDNIITDKIEFNSIIAYPGENQIPMQVDVTNVHTVRSTPTVVGNITAVSAQPYTYAYRLSKDADVRIAVFDASTGDNLAYGSASTSNPTGDNEAIVRTLVDWQPRLGEGMKGQEKDVQITEFDSWDGRNDDGLFLPAGNYVVTIQAKTQDEWNGVDFSRAVTRQLSLDPLKLTDVVATGLNKKSTAYASIAYVPTEAAKVYWNIYTPGTTFNDTLTDSSTQTGTAPTPTGGALVYSQVEDRTARMNFTNRWDGLCGIQTGCTRTYAKGEKLSDGTACTAATCTESFAYGAPLPDGNYVYALWAEIPYNGSYKNRAGNGGSYPAYTPGGTCATGQNAKCFTGVKTLNYEVGQIAIERGAVDITIQPVSYSTVGSSPTAYGLDPFIFKYSIVRDATVVAKVTNSAGVPVKHLTPEVGITQVAQQMNTLSWDGRDDQGRMVAPGTYMFRVDTKDAMFPAITNTASAVFPVDMYRVVDVSTTDVYGDSEAKATITYSLSKAMNVQVNIYNKDVVIPNYNDLVGKPASWPPVVCNTTDHNVFATSGAVDPAKWAANGGACIYVNDTTFTNYPGTATDPINARLQPIKTFERSALRVGDGIPVTEEWDALYFNNPTSTKGTCTTATDITTCPYEMVPDGQYPFYISAQSEEPFNRYYANLGEGSYLQGAPFKTPSEIKQQNGLYATEKPTGKINVTRGPVYFLDGSVVVYPNAPQLFNASSGPVFIPPYEINFSVSRASTVAVDIIALEGDMCYDQVGTLTARNAAAGAVCKHIDPVTFINTSNFDPNIARKVYWDGTDNNGMYVKPGVYEVRLTAKNYPDNTLYQETVKSITVNADLLKVFDLLEADGYAISQRNTDMKIGYQISVPMKVALQIFKPGTTIYNYQKGTLRNPTTGTEVQDIREVLVRAIVGIRPATTLIEELWDGRDYAQQEVPDGTYPFRFVTALDSADIDSVTGEIIGDYLSTDGSATQADWKINKVADTYEYQNLHKATIAIGDGRFVCEDWEKTVFFYPNPLKDASKGTLEITKMPVPGTVSIKFFNLAGDLVRDGGYTCVDANNYQISMGDSLTFNPDNNPVGSTQMTAAQLAAFPNVRNAALRCRWDRTNQHGKRVARGVYFGLVDFKASNGREHCQKVVKILVP
ncbi:MAG: hypothetical protein E7027_00250 [Elusimicrobium sp.]|uniref:FlgD Ig-like domain-containing protein n=1 Tax=Candidatus Avelusimicrobium gallicola TaxID=2562704 RepID=A0A928DNF4_9BACT|nr:hypothetical protein [Elusimicrobium sp.]